MGGGKDYLDIISAEGHAGSGAGFPLTFAAVSRACILGNYTQEGGFIKCPQSQLKKPQTTSSGLS